MEGLGGLQRPGHRVVSFCIAEDLFSQSRTESSNFKGFGA